MSLNAYEWALKDAPISNPTAKLILITLADTADDDGCGAFLSKKTIAKYALVDPKTVQRHLAALKQAGILAEGDQSRANYIPAHRRPVVYDLQIPYTWFGSK